EREQRPLDEVQLLVGEREHGDLGARRIEPRAPVAERGRERALAAAEEAVGAAPAVATVDRLHLEAAAQPDEEIGAQVRRLPDGEGHEAVVVAEGLGRVRRRAARAEALEGERGRALAVRAGAAVARRRE